MNVTVDIPIYEVDDQDVSHKVGSQRPVITVKSHGNRGDLVVLCVDGRRLTVVAQHLHGAVQRAEKTYAER